MKQRFINAYMKAAETFADLSHARRLHVGAIVVKDDRIISIGYNGTPPGWDNNCEEELKWPNGVIQHLITKPEVIHAEMNAIGKLAQSNESGQDATMFITHQPCMECSKLIATAGIRNVFYKEEYRDDSGVKFLEKCGVKVEKVVDNEK